MWEPAATSQRSWGAGGDLAPGGLAGVCAALPSAAFSGQKSLAQTRTGGRLEMGAGRQSLGPSWVASWVACGLWLLEHPVPTSGMMTPFPVPGGPGACSRVVDWSKQRNPESGVGVLWVLGTHLSTALPGRQRTWVQAREWGRARRREGRREGAPSP